MKANLIALAVVGVALPTSGWTMDCAKVTSVVEKEICADPLARSLDQQLAGIYMQALRERPDLSSAIKLDERDWLAERDDRAWQFLSGAVQEGVIDGVLRDMYRSRIEWLKAVGMKPSSDSPLLRDLLGHHPAYPDIHLLGSWWKDSLPGVSVADRVESASQITGHLSGLKLSGFTSNAIYWLPKVRVGGRYEISGTEGGELWTLFRLKEGEIEPLTLPVTMQRLQTGDMSGQLVSYQNMPYAVNLDTHSDLPATLGIEAQAYREGGWAAPQYIEIHYAYGLHRDWSQCQVKSCVGLDAEAMRIADHHMHDPLPKNLQPKSSSPAWQALEHLKVDASKQSQTVGILAQQFRGDYPSLPGYGSEAGYLTLSWHGHWLLGRIGHPHLAWRTNGKWLLSFWYEDHGRLKPFAGYVFSAQARDILLGASLAPPPLLQG